MVPFQWGIIGLLIIFNPSSKLPAAYILPALIPTYTRPLLIAFSIVLSKDYQRTYSTCVTDPYMLTRLLTIEELQSFDAVVVSGGDAAVLCREMIRTGFDRTIEKAINNGLVYVRISQRVDV